ncbi:MAG: IclR family transcriptional regulator [bacterium]
MVGKMIKKDASEYIVHSVSHAMDILESFLGDDAEQGVTTLSMKLKLPKNNIFRLLSTLQCRGYVEQNENTGNYRLGMKTFELGQAFLRRMGLVNQAHSILDHLVLQTSETAYLSVYEDGEVIYVDMVETKHPVRIIPMIGKRVPAHCTAVGKVQLAYKSREEIKRIIKERGLRSYTPNTVVDEEVFLAHLEEVARNGYAIDNEEYEEEVRCVACPVWDYTNSVVAGVTISGPTLRMPEERIRDPLIPILKQAALEISHRLGYHI